MKMKISVHCMETNSLLYNQMLSQNVYNTCETIIKSCSPFITI